MIVKLGIFLTNTLVLFSGSIIDKQYWKLIGRYNNWNPKDWEVPFFKRKDLVSDKWYIIFYNDALEEIDSKEVTDLTSLDGCPEDGLAGYGFVEKRLSRLLTI